MSEKSPGSEPDADQYFPIGSIAADAGVTIATLRHYDKIGLIEPAHRLGGKRRFTADTVGRVSFIRRAQHLGFSLEEIRLILDDQDRRWPELVQSRIAELQQRRAELDTMIGILRNLSECGCHVVADCNRLDQFG